MPQDSPESRLKGASPRIIADWPEQSRSLRTRPGRGLRRNPSQNTRPSPAPRCIRGWNRGRQGQAEAWGGISVVLGSAPAAIGTAAGGAADSVAIFPSAAFLWGWFPASPTLMKRFSVVVFSGLGILGRLRPPLLRKFRKPLAGRGPRGVGGLARGRGMSGLRCP